MNFTIILPMFCAKNTFGDYCMITLDKLSDNMPSYFNVSLSEGCVYYRTIFIHMITLIITGILLISYIQRIHSVNTYI